MNDNLKRKLCVCVLVALSALPIGFMARVAIDGRQGKGILHYFEQVLFIYDLISADDDVFLGKRGGNRVKAFGDKDESVITKEISYDKIGRSRRGTSNVNTWDYFAGNNASKNKSQNTAVEAGGSGVNTWGYPLYAKGGSGSQSGLALAGNMSTPFSGTVIPLYRITVAPYTPDFGGTENAQGGLDIGGGGNVDNPSGYNDVPVNSGLWILLLMAAMYAARYVKTDTFSV